MNFKDLRNKEKDLIMRNNHKMWKSDALDEAGYFIIFQGFLESGKLKNISGNALKLYIYLGLNSNNYEGIVWHSNKKIADYFDKSERTIRSWMKELEDRKLIKRMRIKYDGNVYTYLQPYIYKYDSKIDEDIDLIIEGYLFIDQIGGLYIKSTKINIPITSTMNVELWNSEKNEWISGKIEIRRLNYFNFDNENEPSQSISYVFRSFDSIFFTEIKNDKKLKVRTLYMESL